MYLKSIALKGFKSFAKKSTMTLDKGITCVVGPNGSGKSNISDALLWVLGERSAKNIRGEAMSDVIFSGSSKAKKCSFAEVSIVLDNSDSTLNIDYSDVVITRRAYASGESEYLLNDSKVRRADIVRVLSDSGLGQGTHSIISQGSLDSILSLDEMELREVIEETAGVLRHKQTKEKTIKKLDNLVVNMERINDIIFEVERQLEPLQRKAKRAETYLEIKDELKLARLQLAIDDHRKTSLLLNDNKNNREQLQAKEGEINREISKLEASINEKTEEIREISKHNEDRNKTSIALNNAVNGTENVLNTIISRIEDAKSKRDFYTEQSLEMSKKVASIDVELADANNSTAALKEEHDTYEEKCRAKRIEIDKTDFSIDEKKSEYESSKQACDNHVKEINELVGRIEGIKASLAGKQNHLTFLNDKRDDLESRIVDIQGKIKESQEYFDNLVTALESCESHDRSCRDALSKCVTAKSAAEEALADAKMKEQSLSAQIDALCNVAKKQDVDSDLENFKSSHKVLSELSSLAGEITVDAQFEDAIEVILGEKLKSLVTGRQANVTDIIKSLQGECDNLAIPLMVQTPIKGRSKCENSLANYVHCKEDYRALVDSLLGDIAIYDNLDNANLGERFVTFDGHYCDGEGLVVLNIAKSRSATGTLTRKRQIEEMKSMLLSAKENTEKLSLKLESALDLLQDAQKNSLLATEEMTKVKTQLEASKNVLSEQKGELGSLEGSLNEVNTKIATEATFVDTKIPEIERMEQSLEDLRSREALAKSFYLRLDDEIGDLKERQAQEHKEFATLTSQFEILKERLAYKEAIAKSKKQTRTDSLHAIERYKARLKAIEQVTSELENLRSNFENLCELGLNRQKSLLELSQADETTKIYEDLSNFRERVSTLRDAKDSCTKEISDLMIEKTKLDIDLDNISRKIEDNSDKPMLELLTSEALRNREEVEQIELALSKKMQRLGNIDLSADREYQILKGRYDYLCRHSKDMQEAILAIKKIDHLIEERFKVQFNVTFAALNENFQDIFATLFPGGNSEIELVDGEEGIKDRGVLIKANPAGKKITRMSLLSGGERSLTALSFLFALYNTRKTPFYVLDEVEAALDDTNLTRLLAYINDLRCDTQFIMITHQRRTMEMADLLFGVSMQDDGITRVISQRLSDFNEQEQA